MKKTEKLQVFSVAPLLAEAIRRTHFDESLHTLFSGQW
jgi:phosphoribosylpyrophosphate synthetase